MNTPRVLSHSELLQLKRWNTPTIYNGWEQITKHNAAADAFNIEECRDFMPQMGPMVGYAVTVVCEGQQFDGVANIGYSPTFDDYLFTVEVYILDFDRNIYGQRIRVNFIKRIRDELKFSGIAELSEQIKKDVIEARTLLSTTVHVQS